MTTPKPRLTPRAADIRTRDSFQNFLASVGYGTGSIADGGSYGLNPITRNRVLLENMYRGSWISGQVVDAFAEDATREGVEIHTSDTPDKIQELEQAAQDIQLWTKLGETIKWARLYGGSLGYLMIDGQDPTSPLRIDTIRKGQFKGLLPLDRWMVQPSLSDLIRDLGPNIGKPKFYEVLHDTTSTGVGNGIKIHHSRVIRLEGVTLPYWQRISENGWGLSILDRLYDRLVAFDSATQGTAQLVYKAYLRTVKIKDLRQIIAAGGPAMQALTAQMNFTRVFQTNEGISLIDAEDDFQTYQYSFGGLGDVLLQLGQQLSGASGIPLVRLFGQSPAGLNSTGESDLRTYYDNVRQVQKSTLKPDVLKVYTILYHSTFGSAPPKSFDVEFKPLWQLSDEQRANITNSMTAAVLEAFEKQVIDRSTALKELRQASRVTGVFSNITDKMIKEADDEPPAPGPEDIDPETPGAGDEGRTTGESSAVQNQPRRTELRAVT